MIMRRRFGYIVWGTAGLLIAIPEITAAISHGALHFTTISEMSGHLEYLWSPTELIVIALIVFALFSLLRVRPPSAEAAAPRRPLATELVATPLRTPGGRLTRPAKVPEHAPGEFDADDVSGWFVLGALAVAALVALGTFLAYHYWGDNRHFHPAYVLYGSLALFFVVLPSSIAFLGGHDAPFPTLFRTVANLERALQNWRWRPFGLAVGPAAAWLVSLVIVWGLAVLLLHITLYPFPDITHILNPKG